MDQRHYSRYQVEFPATFKGDCTGVGIVYNLGMGGCKVVSDLAVTPGAILLVHLQIPDETFAITVQAAIARWTMQLEFGVEFLGMDEFERARLQQFIVRLQRAAA
jgi:c-di-GMP-binding flagellar brake protein YcgR